MGDTAAIETLVGVERLEWEESRDKGADLVGVDLLVPLTAAVGLGMPVPGGWEESLLFWRSGCKTNSDVLTKQ